MYVRICLCVCVHVHVYANVYVYVLLILFLWRTVTLLYPPTAEHTSFSSSHGSLTRKDHILSHEVHLNKSNSLVIIQSMLSDYKGIKLDISNCKVVEKSPNICRLNKTLLKNNCVNKETSKEIKKCELNGMRYNLSKFVGSNKSNIWRETYGTEYILEKEKMFKINNLSFTLGK